MAFYVERGVSKMLSVQGGGISAEVLSFEAFEFASQLSINMALTSRSKIIQPKSSLLFGGVIGGGGGSSSNKSSSRSADHLSLKLCSRRRMKF